MNAEFVAGPDGKVDKRAKTRKKAMLQEYQKVLERKKVRGVATQAAPRRTHTLRSNAHRSTCSCRDMLMCCGVWRCLCELVLVNRASFHGKSG